MDVSSLPRTRGTFRSQRKGEDHCHLHTLTLPLVPATTVLCLVASVSITAALVMTHFHPGKLRIHPIPYLSDASMRDPERIVMSFGLSLTGAVFLPIGIAQYLYFASILEAGYIGRDRVVRIHTPIYGTVDVPPFRLLLVIRVTAVCTSIFVSLFSAIPGRIVWHHVFAIAFAFSAATWCLACTLAADIVRTKVAGGASLRCARRLPLKYALSVAQLSMWLGFGLLWVLVKVGWPYKLIPNKDPRFVVLATLEYASTLCLLLFIRIGTEELPSEASCLRLALGPKDPGRVLP